MMTSAAPHAAAPSSAARPSAARYVKRPPMHPAMRQAMSEAGAAAPVAEIGRSGRAGRASVEARRQPAGGPAEAPIRIVAAPASAAPEMRRPPILARAARAGAALYRREHHLRLALPGAAAGALRDVVGRLTALEADLDAARRAGRPDYAPRRHVLVLSALFAETASALAGA